MSNHPSDQPNYYFGHNLGNDIVQGCFFLAIGLCVIAFGLASVDLDIVIKTCPEITGEALAND